MEVLKKTRKWISLFFWLFARRKTILSNHELFKDSVQFRFWPNFTPESEVASFYDKWERVIELITPIRTVGYKLKRVGSENDGGYVLLDDLDFPLISIGIGDETSFDHEFCKRGQKVFQFDHTINSAPKCCSNPHFYRIGLGELNNKTPKLLSLPEILGKCNLTGTNSAILKIDIEGAEWESLLELSSQDFAPFRQLLIEFHGMDKMIDKRFRDMALQILDKLQSNFFPGYVNGNNNQPVLEFGNLRIPHTFEISYFKRSLYKPQNNEGPDYKFVHMNSRKLPPIRWPVNLSESM